MIRRSSRTMKLALISIAAALLMIGCSRIGKTAGQSMVVDLTAMPRPGQILTPSVLATSEQVLRNRAAVLGANPSLVGVVRKGNKYTIDIPGQYDQTRVRGIYQMQGRLEFFHLANVRDDSMPGRNQHPVWKMSVKDDVYAFTDTRRPGSRPITDPMQIRRKIIGMKAIPVLSGKDLAPNGARVQSGHDNFPLIELTFNPRAKSSFQQFTRMNIGEYVAITLDDKILTVPVIRQEIPGEVVLPYGASSSVARDLAGLLNAGELPFVPKVTSVYGASVRRIP